MKPAFFITGSDTGVGKTLASAVLTLALQATYWKPIQSGTDQAATDASMLRFLTGLSKQHIIPSVYELKAPLSPDQAAALEGLTLELNRCVLPVVDGPLVVEGAGGVWVPLNESACMIDFMQQLNLPVIIVARGTLGTINHTLLTIHALRQRNLTIEGVIFSGELNPHNQIAIEKWGSVKTLFHIPPFPRLTRAFFQKWVLAHQPVLLQAFA